MYRRSGKLVAKAGERTAFIEILLRAADLVGEMDGCRMYLVSEDAEDENVIRVVELWEDKTFHAASLQDGRVRVLIREAMPLMGGAPDGSDWMVVGGHGAPEKSP